MSIISVNVRATIFQNANIRGLYMNDSYSKFSIFSKLLRVYNLIIFAVYKKKTGNSKLLLDTETYLDWLPWTIYMDVCFSLFCQKSSGSFFLGGGGGGIAAEVKYLGIIIEMTGLHGSLRYVVYIFMNAAFIFLP